MRNPKIALASALLLFSCGESNDSAPVSNPFFDKIFANDEGFSFLALDFFEEISSQLADDSDGFGYDSDPDAQRRGMVLDRTCSLNDDWSQATVVRKASVTKPPAQSSTATPTLPSVAMSFVFSGESNTLWSKADDGADLECGSRNVVLMGWDLASNVQGLKTSFTDKRSFEQKWKNKTSSTSRVYRVKKDGTRLTSYSSTRDADTESVSFSYSKVTSSNLKRQLTFAIADRPLSTFDFQWKSKEGQPLKAEVSRLLENLELLEINAQSGQWVAILAKEKATVEWSISNLKYDFTTTNSHLCLPKSGTLKGSLSAPNSDGTMNKRTFEIFFGEKGKDGVLRLMYRFDDGEKKECKEACLLLQCDFTT
jgi:hypothetical protein